METLLVMILGLSTIALLFMIMYSQSQRIDKKIRDKVTTLITDAGGTMNEITHVRVHSTQGVCNYVVKYMDKQGHRKERYVTQFIGFWGQLNGDIRWETPLDVVQREPNSSKEQLISEMDAEIQRLRGVLAAVGTEDSPKSRQ